MLYSRRKKKLMSKLKKNAPKVPDLTCPSIDNAIERLKKIYEKNKPISDYQWKLIDKRLEVLREQNELLRESGKYWYESCKEHLKKS